MLVSGNYKLSFDHLRGSLAGRDAWILVLDTHGINVWCAAGKGLFGTDEVVRWVEAVGLSSLVALAAGGPPACGCSTGPTACA